jgi:hypothetical protein
MFRCFRYIQVSIKENGPFVPTAIQTLPIISYLIAKDAIQMLTGAKTIRMHSVMNATLGEQEVD